MDVDGVLGDPKSSSVPTKSAIYVWGYNYSGQTGRESQSRVPKQLPTELFGCPASRWLDVACGRAHTAAVASDGSLFTWGLEFDFFFISLFVISRIMSIVMLNAMMLAYFLPDNLCMSPVQGEVWICYFFFSWLNVIYTNGRFQAFHKTVQGQVIRVLCNLKCLT